MLQEMGVRVWLPGTDFATVAMPAAVAGAAPLPPTHRAPPVAAPAAAPFAAPPRASPAAQPVRAAAPASTPVHAPAVAGPLEALAGLDGPALASAAAACQACGLCAGRRYSTLDLPTVRQTDWMVVGDPPDEDEDRAGQPFVQAPGVLLDNMLKAVGASRTGTGASGAYLSNVVKCRPPPGRLAQADELAQCSVYLQREIALVQPKVILAMGRFATQLLLGEQPALASLPLGKLRGTVYRYQGVAVVVTYHPKVLLRASADKAKAWADLCLAMDQL